MASVIDNYRDANGEAVQPYYAAYMIEFGYRTPADAAAEHGQQWHYVVWNSLRWEEFERLNGIQPGSVRSLYATEFHAWLAARALDHLARIHVEAA
jgi:hypothetical protein